MDHRHLLFVVVDVSLHFSTIVAHSTPGAQYSVTRISSVAFFFDFKGEKVKHVRWLNAEHMQLEERE